MARHFTLDNEDLVLQELKRQVEKRSGIYLQCFSDCKRLSELLDQSGISISALTLSRCFGISKSTHRPFVSTLNLLSVYLGFRSFNHFSSETNDLVKYALTYPQLQFDAGEYAYPALELAIKVGDWKTTRLILETFDSTKSTILEMVWFLGKQARNHEEKNQLLALLADTETGRKFFYEWFVDEDNPNDYYSDALQQFYQPLTNQIGNKIFYHSFLNSKRIYRGEKINWQELKFINDSSINTDELHYHQLSRLFEMRILSEFSGLNRRLVIEKIIDAMLEVLPKQPWRHQNWILMRSVKALVIAGHFEELIQQHQGLKKVIEKLFVVSEGKMFSNAELALQFIVHASPKLKHLVQTPPTRIQHQVFNEEITRLSLESATALVYTKGPLRQSMEQNLRKFTSNNEHAWVMNLLGK
ncbi:MAG: hypothetical protein EBQ94_01715 [Flavobacteriales bacterium]|nr:hypothetical protein [Crocinitomicaceae bacterium]NBX79087.1 hypothetical protein [Flavobacteriales bacterium]NCA19773.1 hypothetical protein [Crocinitomicaceae bacterium]